MHSKFYGDSMTNKGLPLQDTRILTISEVSDQTRLSIAGMLHYAQLRSTGTKTLGERLGVLREHRSSLENHIRNLRRSAQALDIKIEHYEALLAEQERKHS